MAHHRNFIFEGRAFYHLNQQIRLNRTEDIIFSLLAVTLQRQPFHNALTPARAKKTQIFLAEKSNKCDRRITQRLKKNLAYEEGAFYRLNQRIVPDRTEDIIFSVLAVMLQRQPFHNGLAPVRAKITPNFSLQKNQINVIGVSHKG